MGLRAAGVSSRFSQFRSFDFDTAVFIVFGAPAFDIVQAREVMAEEIQSVARYSAHTNARQPTLRQIRDLGTNVIEEMCAAYESLDAERPAPAQHRPE